MSLLDFAFFPGFLEFALSIFGLIYWNGEQQQQKKPKTNQNNLPPPKPQKTKTNLIFAHLLVS